MRIDRTLSRILNEPLWGWLHSSKVNRVTKGWFTKTRLSTKIFNNNRYCPGRNAARGSRNLKITRNWIYVAKLVTKGVSRFTLFLRPKFAQNVFLFSISPLVSETCYVLFRTKAVQDCVSLLRKVIHSRSIFIYPGFSKFRSRFCSSVATWNLPHNKINNGHFYARYHYWHWYLEELDEITNPHSIEQTPKLINLITSANNQDQKSSAHTPSSVIEQRQRASNGRHQSPRSQGEE